ncbi:thermopsin family protease [Vulcanisaeta distributa]|uniref:thermopsin family protease n=1 Tax=Vulcanisaeta distributa TaxID=164451 RepID=UPI0006D104CB|nr:thermopsin family protease [Vulcanisaeta distributa]
MGGWYETPPVMGGITVVITTVMIITALALVVHAQYVPPPSPNIEFVYWSLSLNSTGYAAVGASGCVPSQQYSLYVFTQSQYNAWYSGHAVNAVYASTIGSTGSQLVILPAGDYVVVVYPAPSNYETCLELRYETSPFGMGISSAPSTPITTNAVMGGFFNITSISGYSLYASEYNIPSGAVSLQLNAWLVVRLADGSTQYFWLQNTMSLLTQSNEFNLVVNVWNYTTYPSTPSNIVGGGGSIQNSTEGYAYIYMTQNMTYSLPFSGYLVIAVEQAGSNTVNVGFGYVIIQSGSYEPPPQVVWYDNATITFNEPIEGAGIEISNQLTPSDLPLNAEFVFGGYSSGVPPAVFNSLSAELALVYWSGTSWLPPHPMTTALHLPQPSQRLTYRSACRAPTQL